MTRRDADLADYLTANATVVVGLESIWVGLLIATPLSVPLILVLGGVGLVALAIVFAG